MGEKQRAACVLGMVRPPCHVFFRFHLEQSSVLTRSLHCLCLEMVDRSCRLPSDSGKGFSDDLWIQKPCLWLP